MDMKAQLVSLHSYLYQNLVHVLIDLSDEQLAYRAPLIDQRPLREVALHAYRPLPTTKEALLDLLQTMQTQIDGLIDRLPSDTLKRTISLPWDAQQNTVDALNQTIGHGLLHVGSIYGIRAFGGFPLPTEEPKPLRGKG